MPEAETPAPTAVVVAGDEEIRVLLRGLLRLHHFRVIGEAEGVDEAVELVRTSHPSLVVADMSVRPPGTPADLFQEARRLSPGLRSVLVCPDDPDAATGLGAAGPDARLHRPFRVRDFAQAIGAVSPESPSVT
jgi:DNA-binding NarL/FixJ family response regulator